MGVVQKHARGSCARATTTRVGLPKLSSPPSSLLPRLLQAPIATMSFATRTLCALCAAAVLVGPQLAPGTCTPALATRASRDVPGRLCECSGACVGVRTSHPSRVRALQSVGAAAAARTTVLRRCC
eukprot:scaffold2768_cov314-Prasinococcus_capsulatus_cf.AAC.13